MIEKDANNYLNKIKDEYFSNENVNYIAVVKESNDNTILDDYIIEIGGNDKKSHIFSRKKSFTQQLLNKETATLSIIDFSRLIDQNRNLSTKKRDTKAIKSMLAITEKYKHIANKIKPVISEKVNYQSFYESVERFDKLTGGISFSLKNDMEKSGTAGAFFTMKKTKGVFMISNAHMFEGNEKKITQPSWYNAWENDITPQKKIIGELIWKSNMVEDNEMDAAIAKIKSDSVAIKKYTRCTKLKFEGVDTPIIGDLVRKCGKKTGLTCGYIRSVNCMVRINWKGHTKIYKNQIITSKMSEKGDSGSVLVNKNNKVVALLFAGSNGTNTGETFATDINTVFNKAFTNDSIKEFI